MDTRIELRKRYQELFNIQLKSYTRIEAIQADIVSLQGKRLRAKIKDDKDEVKQFDNQIHYRKVELRRIKTEIEIMARMLRKLDSDIAVRIIQNIPDNFTGLSACIWRQTA